MEVINDSIYNHPRYYDLIFGADCAAETRFICDVNQKYLKNRATRLFEPACGTGRLMYYLAKRGFEVEGIDLNHKAIEFSNQRSKRYDLPQTAFVANMVEFQAKRKWTWPSIQLTAFDTLPTNHPRYPTFDAWRSKPSGVGSI